MALEPGVTHELTMVVEECMTAHALGNANVRVLATPMLVNYFELAAHKVATTQLAEHQGTVGSRIDIRHLAPTPVGMQVTFRAVVAEVDGPRILFNVEAWDEKERVAEGIHDRFVISMDKFLAGAAAKARHRIQRGTNDA